MSRLHRRAIRQLFSLLRGYVMCDVVMFSSFVLCHWSDNLILTTSLCIMNNWQHSQQCTNLQVSQFWNIWHFSVARMKSTKSTSTFWITATSTQSGDQRNYTSPKNVKFEHNSCRPVGVHVARYICISNASVKSCTRTLLDMVQSRSIVILCDIDYHKTSSDFLFSKPTAVSALIGLLSIHRRLQSRAWNSFSSCLRLLRFKPSLRCLSSTRISFLKLGTKPSDTCDN